MLEPDSKVDVYCEWRGRGFKIESEQGLFSLRKFDKLHVIESGKEFYPGKISKKKKKIVKSKHSGNSLINSRCGWDWAKMFG